MESGNAAPTGCYKCGRPGHWSRDCPDSNPNPNPNSSSANPSNSNFPRSNPSFSTSKAVAEKPKKVPRTRPKLTADILLGDDGLGYVLRHFPHNFKCRGRGHEVSDLGNLIRLYSEWHSRLLPYYSFDEFVHKVEQIASTKRVRTCLRDLRERVASGGDPTKLHESPLQHVDINPEEDAEPADMPFDIFDRATEEPAHNLHGTKDPLGQNNNISDLGQNNNSSGSNVVLLTDEQRARMEANRLRALDRAAARAQSSK